MRILAITCLFAIGCAMPGAEPMEANGSTAAALVDGTPEAIGVLEMVNDSETSFEILDAVLDRRAAQGIVDGRPFETVAQLDAVPYVGPTALQRLVELANEQGFIAQGDDVLGTFDGVTFTAAQAEALVVLLCAR